MTKLKVASILGSFFGVFLLVQDKQKMNNFYLGVLLTAIACICGTLVAIFQRIISQNLHYALSPFYFGVVMFCIIGTMFLVAPSVFNISHYHVKDTCLFLVSGVFT